MDVKRFKDIKKDTPYLSRIFVLASLLCKPLKEYGTQITINVARPSQAA